MQQNALSSSEYLLLLFVSNDVSEKAGYKLHYECSAVGYSVVTASPMFDSGGDSNPCSGGASSGELVDSGGVDGKYKNYEMMKTLLLCKENQFIRSTICPSSRVSRYTARDRQSTAVTSCSFLASRRKMRLRSTT